MSSPSPNAFASTTDWASLSRATRGSLLAVYFTRGAGLTALVSFFAITGWPARIAMIAVWLVPDGLVYFSWPRLRDYLPGPLLTGFSMLLGMLPGVIAEKVAQEAGAMPATTKCIFVVVTAAAMAAMMRLTYRRNVKGPSVQKMPTQMNEPERE